MSIDLPDDLSAAPAGMPPAVRAAIIWTLIDLGFSRDQADAWANGWSCRPDPAMVAHQATAYDDHGIPIHQAINWHQHGFYAYEACPLYDIRWAPADAATIRDLLDGTGDNIDEWAIRGLPAQRVIAYIRAGIDVEEIDVYEAEPGGPESALGMLAGPFG